MVIQCGPWGNHPRFFKAACSTMAGEHGETGEKQLARHMDAEGMEPLQPDLVVFVGCSMLLQEFTKNLDPKVCPKRHRWQFFPHLCWGIPSWYGCSSAISWLIIFLANNNTFDSSKLDSSTFYVIEAYCKPLPTAHNCHC